ncbi:hypothetical protein DP43_3731 [Burkholderia pseudomallei]|nr:hypothetical protein DP43_3731 [Burkholderia pseudomallei]
MPNWFDASTAAPAGKRFVGLIDTGPFQLPALTTQATRSAPSRPTANTSVWFGIPNWFDAATAAPGGKSPAGLIGTGPFQRSAPTTQATFNAPWLSTTNTSV